MWLCLLFASTEAIIVTHNGGSSLDRPDLRYADDDGLQYAALFRQAGARVTLLTQLDKESAALNPNAVTDGLPARAELFAAVKNAKADEIYLIFAGHGERGFLALADGQLSAEDLDEHVITPLAGKRVHLLIDSCNSYFMVMPRKPGGTAFKTQAPEDLLAKHANVSVLLSTSAEAVTYEWSEIQSGIFSYVLRSALRGGADADGDGNITYLEATSFIRTATQSIENDAYRPHVFSHAAQASLFTMPASKNELSIEGAHRVTLRNDKGVRLADVHTSGKVRLWLPEERVWIEERQGTRIVQREIGPAQHVSLTNLTESSPTIAERGESPVFKNLFATPFDKVTAPPKEDAYGVSKAEVDRWKSMLYERSKSERAARNNAAWTFGIASGAMFAGGATETIVNLARHQATGFGPLIGTAGLVLAGVGLPILLVSNTPSEKVWYELNAFRLDTETDRTVAIERISTHLVELMQRERRKQLAWGISGTVLSAGVAALSAFEFWRSSGAGMTYAAISAAVLVNAIHQLVTLPRRIDSVEQLDVMPEKRTISFEGIGAGSDGKGAFASAIFTF